MLFVNRIVTDAILECVVANEERLRQASMSASEDNMSNVSTGGMNMTAPSTSRKLVQCRICHDVDEDLTMEIPCACCGSLKVSRSLIYGAVFLSAL